MAEVSFGEWLKRRRSALGLTQEQLARQINCSTSALRKMEAELRRPSAPMVEQLAKIFNIPPEQQKSFLRFARGDWQALSDSAHEDSPWRVSPVEKQTETPKNNLPLQLTSFIGREKEQAEITDLLTQHRLVTLVGAGGIGKTRLSLEVAREALNTFPDGLWFIELAPLSDPALLPQAIVTTLGLIEQENRPPQTILLDFLKTKRSLLILDNCEHLIQACAQLAETLLRACSDLHILTTSREALDISGETLYRVPSLTIPDLQHVTLDTLNDYEAVQLFVERAQIIMPGFSITSHNAPAIAQACHHLDGIPLALELAAARVKLLRVEEIAARLDDRFRLLTSGSRTALPRHQTLQALIDWSHDLLSEPKRVLLKRLSIFAGGWTLEGAEYVCAEVGQDGILSHQVLDLLTSLVNKSLVIVERKQGQETRYHMLETIRQYARDKLWEAGEGEMMRQRHLAYFVDLAERAEPNLRAFDMVMWLDRLEAEFSNIRTALEYALESDIEAELRLASALFWFWHIRGHRNEGAEWLEHGLSIEAMERGEKSLWFERTLIRGKALNVAGFLWDMIGETNKGAAASEEAVALFQELGPSGRRGKAYALVNLGFVEESLTLFRELRDKFGIAQSLLFLWGTEFWEGNYVQSKVFVEERLAISREIGDKDGIASSLSQLGLIALRQGDYQRAITLLEESLASFREVGNKSVAASVLWYLGDVLYARGDYEEAIKLYKSQLAIGQEFQEKGSIALASTNLGVAAWALGDYEQATKRLEEVLETGRRSGEKLIIFGALYGLGRVALSQGNYSSACSWIEEAVAIAQESNLRVFIAQSLDALIILASVRKQMEPSSLRFEGIRRVAQLFGASEISYELNKFILSPIERAEHDQAVAAARAALGEEAFVAAWEEGKKMTLDEAIAYAVEQN